MTQTIERVSIDALKIDDGQLFARADVPADVRAVLGQQGFQDGPGGPLVKPMLRGGGLGDERFFQERHPQALRSSHFL